MEIENNDVITWRIQNFSCWNFTSQITTQRVIFYEWDTEMRLCVKGTDKVDPLCVLMSIRSHTEEISGDLSLVVSDGPPLCTKMIHHEVEGEFFDLEVCTELSFKEVIDRIGENCLDQKDQLILRLQVKSDRYREHYICTEIGVVEVTVEMDVFKTTDYNKWTIEYKDGDIIKNIHLKSRWIDKELQLYMYVGYNCTFPYYVQTHLIVLSSGSLVTYENNEHEFREKEQWLFSNYLSEKELLDTPKSLILCLKITSGQLSYSRKYMELDSGNGKVRMVSQRCVSFLNKKFYQHFSKGVLLKELMGLYDGQDFADIQIRCGNVYFRAHKNILSARSPVFKTMLLSDMKESASGVVDIEDLDAPTMTQFLHFLYKGELGEKLTRDWALKLYYAADKYQVPSLKIKSAIFLTANVSISNVLDVLSLGNKYEDDKIIFAAHKFILRNYNELLRSEEWRKFRKSEPELALETLTHFATEGYVGNFKAL